MYVQEVEVAPQLLVPQPKAFKNSIPEQRYVYNQRPQTVLRL